MNIWSLPARDRRIALAFKNVQKRHMWMRRARDAEGMPSVQKVCIEAAKEASREAVHYMQKYRITT